MIKRKVSAVLCPHCDGEIDLGNLSGVSAKGRHRKPASGTTHEEDQDDDLDEDGDEEGDEFDDDDENEDDELDADDELDEDDDLFEEEDDR